MRLSLPKVLDEAAPLGGGVTTRVDNRGGQIIRSWRGPCPQRVADAARRGRRKCQNAENTWTVQEKRANAAELSPVDPTDVICSSWTKKGEIKMTGLLLATFNKVHILTY